MILVRIILPPECCCLSKQIVLPSFILFTTPTELEERLDYIKYCTVTYSTINLVLLLKTSGGSSFRRLLPKDLREDIPRLKFKLYSYSQVVKRQQFEEFARRLIFLISQAAVTVSEKSSLHINYFKCHKTYF